jgi:hypothetical protein
MQSYIINLRFRGKDVTGTVHKYDAFSFVYFSDSLIIQDFGGQLEFDGDNKFVQEKSGKDLPDLVRSIKSQLR